MSKEPYKEKEFIFPENIDSNYGVIFDLSLKELIIYVVPAIIIGIGIMFIPPYSITGYMIKAFVALLIVTVVIAVLSSKPVKSRNNIRLLPHLRMKSNYSKRQRLFFRDKKKLL